MTLSQFALQSLAGLANAMFLFLVASGLSLIFGVSRIVNFAHGSFYMLAAYLTHTLLALLPESPWRFWLALLLAPAVVALLGGLVEVGLLRRVYHAPELYQLLLTFGLVLIAGDAVRWLWGTENRSVPLPPGLAGSVSVLGQPFPAYYVLVVVLGPLVTAGLWWLLYGTRWGILLRAATADREMVAALGVDQRRLFTAVFVFGSWLAGLGGALAAPLVALTPGMDTAIIVEAFVVVVVGGMGSFGGSLLAALLIGELSSFGILVHERASLVLVFLLMAVVLVVRPWGLLGRPTAGGRTTGARQGGADAWRGPLAGPLGWAAVVVAALALGAWVLPPFSLLIGTEILAFVLFAASLHLLWGYGGMVSFGHAAYFGLGAYGAALGLVKAGLPMPAAFLLGPLAAAAAAAVFGVFCVRLTSIYFAMLTLAFAQIAYTVVFQWYGFTGGDNGLLGVWPPRWLAGPARYYLFALGVTAAGVALLFWVTQSPLGLALRAIRENPRRAEAVGIDVRLHQWLAFVVAGLVGGLGGAVYVFQKGSAFPNYLSVEKSIEPLVMILLGGVGAFLGPVLGAGVFTVLDTVVTRYLHYWGAVLGAILTGLVVLFPHGLLGTGGAGDEAP
ncbi:MAG: ABC transporter permease [Candidatus Rokubacteria bacterium]|nr:ABC transporter permease [Candidatus Rokubacteria bacterium]